MSMRKTVMITGASSGIGESLANIIAAQDYDLILVARSTDKLTALATRLGAEHNVTVTVLPADLAVPGSAGELFQALKRRKLQVDILVNNAGVLKHGAFNAMLPAQHQEMIQLNVVGFTDMLAHFVPPMVARGSGRVLNVASIAAFQPIPSLATYAATKAYVLSLSESLAEELRGSGVTLTTLCPGITATNMVFQAQASSNALQNLPSMVISDVQDVAGEAWRACLKGQAIVVPGTLNLAATVAARATPKWLVRRLTGLLGRSTL
ncbi:short-chain dehydrogenase [Kineobactrum sediminis]|uniref:Short-chain dehydrogenase n=1 Tax=Kineobactrum sediminis TaxID=1905677 RepID=A0A2N5Y4B8_9GAMM|nr:SDR family oxidoreductase [Kineobactrum sediminis]PLW83218.1 short-chain dehydrogenase [Kineobactrum sediminis]